jgi:hypothetical protein
MRRTLVGLLAVGTLVGGACSDDDDESSSGGGSVSEFCATMTELVSSASSDEADPQAAEETLSDLEPPPEIADAWDEYVPLVTGANDVDPNDPEEQAEYQERLEGATEAGETINAYLTEECGISDDSQTGETGSGDPPDTTGDPGQ